jgi:hypothetical protein
MTHDRTVPTSPTGEELLRRRARAFVRERPLLCVAAATALGATLGGILFAKMGRLAFAAVAGYVASEIWHRESRLDVGALVERLSPKARR